MLKKSRSYSFGKKFGFGQPPISYPSLLLQSLFATSLISSLLHSAASLWQPIHQRLPDIRPPPLLFSTFVFVDDIAETEVLPLTQFGLFPVDRAPFMRMRTAVPLAYAIEMGDPAS